MKKVSVMSVVLMVSMLFTAIMGFPVFEETAQASGNVVFQQGASNTFVTGYSGTQDCKMQSGGQDADTTGITNDLMMIFIQ